MNKYFRKYRFLGHICVCEIGLIKIKSEPFKGVKKVKVKVLVLFFVTYCHVSVISELMYRKKSTKVPRKSEKTPEG